ncbi:hypothetical protein [Novosphingobium panipatense]
MRTSFIGRPLDIDAEARRYVDVLLSGVLAEPGEPRGPSETARLSALIDRMEAALAANPAS